jgi:hypothetical protein
MPLDDKVVQTVISAKNEEMSQVEQRFRELDKTIETLLEVQYPHIDRLTAKAFVDAVKRVLKQMDTFVQENEEQANEFFRAALKDLDLAEKEMPEGDPYRRVVRELRGAIKHMYVARGYRDLTFGLQLQEAEKLLKIIEDLKDTALEVQRHEAEKSIYDDVINTLKEENKEVRTENRRLLDRVADMQVTFRETIELLKKLGVTVAQPPPTQGEAEQPEPATSPPDDQAPPKQTQSKAAKPR